MNILGTWVSAVRIISLRSIPRSRTTWCTGLCVLKTIDVCYHVVLTLPQRCRMYVYCTTPSPALAVSDFWVKKKEGIETRPAKSRAVTESAQRRGWVQGSWPGRVFLWSLLLLSGKWAWETRRSARVREQGPLPFLTFVPALVNALQSLFSEEPFELVVQILMNPRLIHN